MQAESFAGDLSEVKLHKHQSFDTVLVQTVPTMTETSFDTDSGGVNEEDNLNTSAAKWAVKTVTFSQ